MTHVLSRDSEKYCNKEYEILKCKVNLLIFGHKYTSFILLFILKESLKLPSNKSRL